MPVPLDLVSANSKEEFLLLIQQHKYVMVPDDMLHDKPGLFFRGDGRPPEVIFNSGFHKKDPSYRNPVVRSSYGDTHPHSTVCFSRLMEVAAIFPMEYEAPSPISYIYLTRLKNRFNTHRLGARIISGQIPSFKRARNYSESTLFAEEVCTNKVDNSDVICALELRDRKKIIALHRNLSANPMHMAEAEQLLQPIIMKLNMSPDGYNIGETSVFSLSDLSKKMLLKYGSIPSFFTDPRKFR